MGTTLNHDMEGLEVVPGSDFNTEGLEVVPNTAYDGLEASPKVQTANGLESTSKDGLSNMDNIEGARWSKPNNSKRRRLWLIVAAVVLVLVIVGAVVGGVVGSRSSHKTLATPSSSPTPASSTSSPSPSSSATANSVYANSGIGVTGWWTSESDFSIRLAYQGDDSYLHMMQYNSGDDGWSTMTILTNLDLGKGSPIAISCFNSSVFFNSAVNSNSVSNISNAFRGTHAVSNECRCRTSHRSKFFTSMTGATSQSGGSESNKCQSSKP